MVDKISGSDQQQIYDLRSQYEKRRKELITSEEQKLSELEKYYQEKKQNIQETGSESVSQTRESTEQSVEQAEIQAKQTQDNRKASLEQQVQNLKDYEKQQIAYLDQAKKRQSELTKQQIAEAHERLSTLKGQKDDEYSKLNNYYATQMRKTEQAQTQELSEVQQKTNELKNQTIAEANKELQTIEARNHKEVSEQKNYAKKTLDQEQTALSDRLKGMRKNFSEYETKETLERKEVQKKQEDKFHQLSQKEIEQHQHEFNKLQKDHEAELRREVKKSVQEMDKFKGEYEKEVKTLEQQGDAAITEEQKKYEQKNLKQKEDFKAEMQKLEGQQISRRDERQKTYQEELGRNEVLYNANLKEQHNDFEKQFGINKTINNQSLRDQQETFVRSMQNQKKEMVQKFKVYEDVKEDPFYRIQDFSSRINELSDRYIFEARIPEHEKNNIHVRVQKDKVSLTGNRAFQEKVTDQDRAISTAQYQTFHEDYPLKHPAREKDIMQEYKDGTLTVVIPKV